MKTAHDYLRPYVGAEPGPYLAYADAVKAVQAVIDHYEPPAQVNPPACKRCTQRLDQCVCPLMFPDSTPF